MAEQEEADAGGMWLYKAGVPRFSLVLWSKPFREGKLRLPKGFAKEHGAQLANEVLLKLPNGAEWQVSVVRGRKRIWFVKGWSEFAEFYSLKPTNYLVFGLASPNRLNVIIFDTTATEIDYSNKKVNIKVESECDIESNEASGKGLGDNGKQGRGFKVENRSCTPGRTKSAYGRAINERAIGILAKANVVFESENPFFTSVIQKTHLIPGRRLNVPTIFFKTYFLEERGNILLQLPNVGLWNVEYLFIDYSYQNRAFFEAKSWGSFARANSLKVGDVCAFELVEDGTEPRFNVTIFQTSQVTDSSSPRLFQNGRTNVRSKGNPSPATQSGFTCRPNKHVHSPKTRDKPSLRSPQPHKLRRTDGIDETASSSKGQNRNRTPRGKTSPIPTEGVDPLARAKAVFKSENPFFIVVMHPSYIGPGKRLYAPAKFFEKNFTDQCGAIVLQLPDDVRVWRVKYRVGNCGNIKQAIFQSGSWNSFANDNSLRVGDVCGFELVEYCTEPRLNVTIFRASQDGHSHGNTVPFRKHMKKDTRKMELRVGSQVWEVSVNRYEADLEKRRAEMVFITGGWGEFAKGNSLVTGDVCVFELINGEQEEDADAGAAKGTTVRLPKGFAKEHGAQLANEVLLKIPNGAEWQVSVVRGRKRIWFVKGWSEFAEFYSLKPTNYLVFGLASTNRLNVIVFDTTATEVDYSNKKVNIKVESECDIESNEALERPSPSSPRARGKSSLKPLKLRRRNITERTASDKRLGDNGKQGRGFKVEHRSYTPGRTKSAYGRAINERAIGILAKANVVFESENPFFMSVIQKTHLIPGRRLNVPTIFFKTYFLEERGNILLQLPNVGLWNVEYLFIDYSYQNRAFFEAKSWGSFARANSLKVGDVCAFELVEGGTEPRFDVTIFQTSQVTDSSSSRLFQNGRTSVPATQSGFTCRPNKHVHSPKTRNKPSLRSPQPHKLRRTDGMDETASSSKGQNRSRTPRGKTSSIPTEGADPLARAKAVFKSENPFFIVVMHPSYIGPGKKLYAPGKFFEKNFADQCGAIVLQLPDDVGVWRVKYRVRNYGNIKQAIFQSGSWNSFANDNSLRVGDVCVFELVECCTEPRLNVTFFRASQDGHSHGNTGNTSAVLEPYEEGYS
ncbi:B3 domain-containing protein Os03g0619800 [Linum perenne]